jgi:hypothetical protein
VRGLAVLLGGCLVLIKLVQDKAISIGAVLPNIPPQIPGLSSATIGHSMEQA